VTGKTGRSSDKKEQGHAMHRLSFLALGILVVSGSLGAAQEATGQSTVSMAPAPRAITTQSLPGTRGNLLSTIRGNALTSTNGTLANAPLRLRDARAGHIMNTARTDKAGLFEFTGVEPGSYIVELVGDDQSVLAASQILNVNAGDAVSAVVKLPFRIPPFAGVLGHSVTSAAIVAATAAVSGVLATQVAGSDVSPRR
jgi:hypothetical protein